MRHPPVNFASITKNEGTFLHFSFELIFGVGHRLVRGAGVGRRGRREELEAKGGPLRPSCSALAEFFEECECGVAGCRCGRLTEPGLDRRLGRVPSLGIGRLAVRSRGHGCADVCHMLGDLKLACSSDTDEFG